jgi:two-component system, NtrC family, sensor histidine kinase HydH
MRHPFRSTTLRAALFLFLVLASSAILYTTFQNTRSALAMADQALESTGLALASTVEAELRSGDTLSANHVRHIFSDRVIAYALVADKKGFILFHTNPGLMGSLLNESGLGDWLQTGQTYGRRITLRSGLPAFEFNYLLHLSDGRAELLRLVLHTFPADQIVSRAQRMWWTVGLVLMMLWTVGILFERLFARQLRLQEALQQRKQLAIIGQMTAVLAHEIRNALGGIKGYTQWVDEKMESWDPKKAGLAFVLKGVQRIETLVDDLLLYSREEIYRPESISVERMIQEVITSEMVPEGKNIVVDIEVGIKITADKEKVHRVLLNGMQNAFQSMEKNPSLQITAKAKGKWVEICLEDRGRGIFGEDLPRLFTPFYTTKTTGTGLGLAYSKKVVEEMGGIIDLFNREDGPGAVLVIKLPWDERT